MAFSVQESLPAVLDGKEYIRDFNCRKYEGAFLRFKDKYSGIFACLLAEGEGRQLADAFFQGLENAWPRKKLVRKEAILETKMMITLYLTPLLLQLGENGAAFAEALCQKWKDARPGESYEICPYEKIKKSFHKVFLGFDLGPAEDEGGFTLFKKR